MGCPGNASGPSLGTERIGAVTWGVGYNYPNVYQNPSSKYSAFSMANYDSAAAGGNPSALNNDSCSCLCSGMYAGKMPFFYQFVRNSTYTSHEDTWDQGWFPGGTTGIYMKSTSTKQWYFNVGQIERCGQIYAGLYQLHPDRGKWMNNSCGTYSWAGNGRLDVTFEYYLWGGNPGGWSWAPNSWFYCSWLGYSVQCGIQNAPNEGGFPYISLCISPLTLGSTNNDGCPLSSCLNSMDYGTGIPSQAIPGGHDLIANCPPSSTVWDTCEDQNCSPNGVCMGPPSNLSPTGCISNNSILNGFNIASDPIPQDNGCFDCQGKPVHHPCYNSGTDVTPLWNGAPDLWESPVGVGDPATYGNSNNILFSGCNTMGTGDDYGSTWDYNPASNGEYYGELYMQTKDWDSCCMYKQFGCPDPSFANWNAATTTAKGIDCAGNADPSRSRYWDAPNSQWICENVSWVNGGATTFSWTNNAGESMTSTQPSAGNPVPCDDPTITITNNTAGITTQNIAGHPYAWNKTNYQSADTCCCSDAGCKDDGQGPLAVWGTPPNDRYSPTVPGFSWASAGGNTDYPFYPGYSVMVGVSSPVNLMASSQAASNYCAACTEDCNEEAPGTYNPGWANCCQYQISGCMDDTALPGGHPDIFGGMTSCLGSSPCLVWNFNPLANVNDGSCFYEEPITGCIDDGGLGLSTVGMPPYPNPAHTGIPANNYNPVANISDGSCQFDAACPDLYASNYDPCADPSNYNAIAANTMVPACYSTNPDLPPPTQYAWVADLSLCVYDIPGAGPGCMDPQAINYNPLATTDCNDNLGPPGPPYPADFSCCTYPTEGCTDPNAWNYNSLAMIDDGSCEYVIRPFQDEVNYLNGTQVLLCREPLTKEEVLMNVAEPPEIQSEIFIERGKQSVIEPNQRLGEIKTMGGLVNYAYGYYKIKKQE